ncbi:MAG: hypothetical protein KatS3mg113_0756 [Planctomycetaceae bacterium]|nr:MAG: hypothetical protein KatS3mg113_0756 [Planctomycetaceae bacterium]
MSLKLFERLLAELEQIVLIDPHSHINPHAAASKTLADILGYHYYTELAHSAGMPRSEIEQPGLDPRTKVARIIPWLAHLNNTIQLQWLIDLCQRFFDFEDDRITLDNWEPLYERSQQIMTQPGWEQECLRRSNLERIFLTNDFDDPLEGFDRWRYIPCLRTDELVFHLTRPEVQQRLTRFTRVEVTNSHTLKEALGVIFDHFMQKQARACAISLPPWFTPRPVGLHEARAPLQRLLAHEPLSNDEQATISYFIFWTLAELCADHQLPFDLMIGVNRRVYRDGVYQGQDLYDQRVSLIQYQELFNAFPRVTFPVSVLAPPSNGELVSYAWIFPNVVVHGHWWYSNMPACILQDCRLRLQAIPRNKILGYYSDMYKLEFGWPKFQMYRRALAKILAEDFVIERGWSEEEAISLGRQILRDNVDKIFKLTD